jgi:hypothetical protein
MINCKSTVPKRKKAHVRTEETKPSLLIASVNPYSPIVVIYTQKNVGKILCHDMLVSPKSAPLFWLFIMNSRIVTIKSIMKNTYKKGPSLTVVVNKIW